MKKFLFRKKILPILIQISIVLEAIRLWPKAITGELQCEIIEKKILFLIPYPTEKCWFEHNLIDVASLVITLTILVSILISYIAKWSICKKWRVPNLSSFKPFGSVISVIISIAKIITGDDFWDTDSDQDSQDTDYRDQPPS